MATNTILARPYAKAAFEHAFAQNSVSQWQDMLLLATMLIKNEQVKSVLNHPRIAQEKKLALFLDLLKVKGILDQHRINFIKLLANKNRLCILPEIAQIFMTLRKEKEKKIQVIIKSAFPLDQEQQEQFRKALKIRLQAEIELKILKDKSLIGGAKIYADDFVMDGSVKTQLERLKQTLLV